MDQVISKQIVGVNFGFFSAEEIQKLSVKRITSPFAFDNLGQPVPDGLYDLSMGPTDKFATCVTCLLPQQLCPGHMGHIEPPVPLYNPLLFAALFKLIRSKCFVCHKFRASRVVVKKAIAKLKLLDAGLMLKSIEVDDLITARGVLKERKKKSKAPGKQASAVEEDEDADADADAATVAPKLLDEASVLKRLDALIAQADAYKKSHPNHSFTVHEMESRKEAILSFWRSLPTRRCANCRAYTPALRRDGSSKIFQLPLSEKMEKHMVAMKRKIGSVLDQEGSVRNVLEEEEQQMALKLQAKEVKSKATKRKKKSSHGLVDDEAEEASEEEEEEEAERETSSSSESESDGDSEKSEEASSEEEDDDDVKPKMKSRSKKNKTSAANVDDEELKEKDLSWTDKSKKETPAQTAAAKKAEKEKKRPRLLFQTEVEKHMELLWQEERDMLALLWGSLISTKIVKQRLNSHDYKIFFVRIIAVPPPRFRPATAMGEMTIEHPQNYYFKRILESSREILLLRSGQSKSSLDKSTPSSSSLSLSRIPPPRDASQAESIQNSPTVTDGVIDMNAILAAWLTLQDSVNCLFDSSKSINPNSKPPNGIRQILEKKHGLFRMNMMGKRVNFAARSVISPDPYIHTGEIGIPERFAKNLTYPQPVNAFNIEELRRAVINGPDVHPGANFVEDESGNMVNLAHRTTEQRVAISKTLLTTGDLGYDAAVAKRGTGNFSQVGPKRVLRHLKTGDILLVNRQPTLHKPSIMAHKARVLTGQKTIRMHYANCNTYNADFDGDEMNVHLVQNELARAEAYNIVNTDNQYCKPTDGTPLRGLIQDHVLTGVLLTKRDTFFTREDFQQLIYATCPEVNPTVVFATQPPVIWKPKQLWTGKQVITAILNIVIGSQSKLTMTSKAKIPAKSWGPFADESDVLIRKNELLRGVLDKSQFGATAYGMVHACYQLFGSTVAGNLLTTLGRLFTIYLQSHGFTCGIDDLIVVESAEKNRRSVVSEANLEGIKTSCRFSGLKPDDVSAQSSTINRALGRVLREDPSAAASLDNAMKTTLNPMTSKIIEVCLPVGQLKPFPYNCFSLMTLSGAKGSMVNFSQIACLLGQQELEGRRVPMMASGKTLPSFRKYDPSPRAGGYVTDRFLTGIKPQEYYFHCMAGREGLVDTAVKTSRSGYLQRCLVKHLESLCVAYDHTVRDTDGSIIQFHYGEDSIDVSKGAYLTQFQFALNNFQAVVSKLKPAQAMLHVEPCTKGLQAMTHKFGDEAMKGFLLDPIMSLVPPGRYLGSVSDKYGEMLQAFIDARGKAWPKDHSDLNPIKFEYTMQLNYMSSLVHPGESVGILAAQSIGEPSTQMTLNTFHLAGHGGANVTLGIPRLREIIMTATNKPKTPIMELPLVTNSVAAAEALANELNRLKLRDFIEKVTVRESMSADAEPKRLYVIRLHFFSMTSHAVKSNALTFYQFQTAVEIGLIPKLIAAVTKELKKEMASVGKEEKKLLVKKPPKADKKPRALPTSASELSAMQADGEDSQEKVSSDKADSDDPMGSDDEVEYLNREEAAEDGSDAQRDGDSGDSDDDPDDAETSDTGDVLDSKHNTSTKKPASKAHQSPAPENESGDVPMTDATTNKKATPKPRTTKLARKSRSSAGASPYLRTATYDDKGERWAEIAVCANVLLKATPGIGKCVAVDKLRSDGSGIKDHVVQTEGVNFPEIWLHSGKVDVTKIYSNDIAAVLNTYGVEAARACITREVGAVFKVYGISVDLRHLGLVADYMTFQGGYRPLNRLGLDSNTSPFQKISFETSMNFMISACISNDTDLLASPSSRIVIGEPVPCGTGKFELVQPLLPVAEEEIEEE